MTNKNFRSLPAVHVIQKTTGIQKIIPVFGQENIVAEIRKHLDELRKLISDDTSNCVDISPEGISIAICNRLAINFKPKLRKVINATGIVLHTNLGRSPMAEEAANAAYMAAGGYINLEVDIETGKRSSRQDAVREWICRLLKCESATVVNNCAAATIIVLKTIAESKEVIISRGQLIEIGGSFRLPEIMNVSNAIMREVGSTNITRIKDYESAVGPNTGALIRVHTSNYKINGFTESVTIQELIELGKKHGIPVIDDAGSGAIRPLNCKGFEEEPNPVESIALGADITLFSGDKLLGGPQAGIIAGKKDWIKKIESNPLMRAFRLDKMNLAALEQTLLLHLNPSTVSQRIPTLQMLSLSMDKLHEKAIDLQSKLKQNTQCQNIEAKISEGFAGGGTLPDQQMPTWVVEFSSPRIDTQSLSHKLRVSEPSLFTRVKDDKIVLDLRTLKDDEINIAVQIIFDAIEKS